MSMATASLRLFSAVQRRVSRSGPDSFRGLPSFCADASTHFKHSWLNVFRLPCRQSTTLETADPSGKGLPSVDYACRVFNELIAVETDRVKLIKLEYLLELWEQRKKSERSLQEALHAKDIAVCEAITAKEVALRAKDDTRTLAFGWVTEQKKAIATLTVDYLKAKGLDDCRGLFEHLQEKILDKHAATRGMKGSETTWVRVLQVDPQFAACLRQHLGPACNLASHLAFLYQFLSEHVHAPEYLTATGSTIEFQVHYLTPQQCSSLVCMGIAAGVNVQPAPRT